MLVAGRHALKTRVLVDTSVWIEFIRFGNPQLSQLLNDGEVLMHDMIVGEIACGSASKRSERLEVMNSLPKINRADHTEVLAFIDTHQLYGCGIGYVDNHLLAAVLLHGDCCLWSRDKRLFATAKRLGIAFEPIAH